MSDRRDPLDDIPPVPLREPPPDPAPENDLPERLHPGWLAFLAEGEVPLWHGRATIRKPSLWPRLVAPATAPSFIAIGLVAWLVGLWPAAFLAVFLLPATVAIRHDWVLHAPREWSYYLLTGRAAYIAREGAHELQLVRRIPVDRALGIELGVTSVRFQPGEGEGEWSFRLSPGNQFYERFDDGFYGIPDAENVYEIMRAIQKGQP